VCASNSCQTNEDLQRTYFLFTAYLTTLLVTHCAASNDQDVEGSECDLILCSIPAFPWRRITKTVRIADLRVEI
jgi:hypothetical protein